MDKVYHGSNIGGLKIIEPRVSSHDKSFVYASTDIATATLFLARWNDYIFRVGYIDGKLHIVENYANALKDIYENKKGYIYVLNGEEFRKDDSLWCGEVICEKACVVEECKAIKNILEELYTYSQHDFLEIYEYPNRPDFYPMDDSDLIEKLERDIKNWGNRDKRVEEFLKIHPNLANRVKNC